MTSKLVKPSPQNARALSDVARELANALISLKALGVTDRWIFSEILKATLERHPHFWGVWTIWEPDALDGRDSEFANQEGHDASGRYVPLWKRTRAGLQLEPNVGYSEPGVGDYYLIPIQKQQEVVFAPYAYLPADGETRRIISQVAPIFDNGRCVGVAGFDILAEDAAQFGITENRGLYSTSGAALDHDNLSKRESEVLSWVSRGKSNAEIGIILGISAHTVKHHMEKIFSKLGVENRHAAMLCALQPFMQRGAQGTENR
jgi:DNA-binding CsgD family transcriptional regulator